VARRMRIAFVHFPGRLSRLGPAPAGTGPTEFLFGAVELDRAGVEVEHYEVDPDAAVSRAGRRLVDRNAGLGRLPPHLSAAVLVGTRALLPRLREADVVVATTTATSMALACWSKVGLLRRPLVGIVAGLLNRPWGRTRRLTTIPLLRRFHVVIYGPGELQGLRALDRRLADRVHVVEFGVDAHYWTPLNGTQAATEVVAIGNDGHRDWGALVSAASDIPAQVRVVTAHARPDELPPNVTWQAADWYTQVLSDDDVRDLYRRAAVVVVPVKDVPQPSGQSVALQAMACGRPVVLSNTRGLWAPAQLRDGANIVLVAPEDPQALAGAVRRVLADKARAESLGSAARATILRYATVEAYAERLLDVCRLAIEAP
jgi:Glycosyl transferases group 1